MPEELSDSSSAEAEPQVKQDLKAISAARVKVESFAEFVEKNATEVEDHKAAVSKSKTAIDHHVTEAEEKLTDLNKRVDEAKAATAIAEQGASAISALEAQGKAAVDQASTALNSAEEANAAATNSAGEIDQMKAKTAEWSKHIEDGKIHSDQARTSIDQAIQGAQEAVQKTEAKHQASRESVKKITAFQTSAEKAAGAAQASADAVAATKTKAEGHAVTTKKLAETAANTQERVDAYEKKLTELQEASEKEQVRIDSLLMGATNAGLGHAYHDRAKTFQGPERMWNKVFVGSLAGLLIVAFVQALIAPSTGTVPEWDHLPRMMLANLPFLLPFAWLAIYAVRQAANAKRMEEDYGFKATSSTSFEGYRRHMAEIGKDLDPASPLGVLCSNTLRIIGSPPGQVYEKHRIDPTPASAVAEVVVPIVDKAAEVLPAAVKAAKG